METFVFNKLYPLMLKSKTYIIFSSVLLNTYKSKHQHFFHNKILYTPHSISKLMTFWLKHNGGMSYDT